MRTRDSHRFSFLSFPRFSSITTKCCQFLNHLGKFSVNFEKPANVQHRTNDQQRGEKQNFKTKTENRNKKDKQLAGCVAVKIEKSEIIKKRKYYEIWDTVFMRIYPEI